MTDLLTRAASWLVAPRDEIDPERPTTRWLAPTADERLERTDAPRDDAPVEAATRIAVIGAPADVPAVAASVALSTRRQTRASTGLVIVWPSVGEYLRAGASSPPARLLAGRLRRRGFAAHARGRLVWLPAGDDASVVARAEGAAGHVPCVLAVTAPRDEDVDAMLAGRDLVVVAADPASALAALALDELTAIGVPAVALAPPPPGLPRIAALAGLRPYSSDRGDFVKEAA